MNRILVNSPSLQARASKTKRFLKSMCTQKSLFLDENPLPRKHWVLSDDTIFNTTEVSVDQNTNFEKDVLLKRKKRPFKGIGSRLFAFDPVLAERIYRRKVLSKFDQSVQKLSDMVGASPNLKLKSLEFYQQKSKSTHLFSKKAYLRSLNFDFRNPIQIFK